MSVTPSTPLQAPRRRTARRTIGLGITAAVGAASLLAPAAASAAHVTSLEPWKATNAYLAKADIDGRTAPQLEPRAKVNYVKKGSWVRITCQTTGQMAYGSKLWDKVGSYYVPDQLLKTYTDGALKGVPKCGPGQQPPTTPQPPTPPSTPEVSGLWDLARSTGFGPLPADTKRIVERTPAKTGKAGVVMFRFFIPNSQAGGRLLKGDGRGWNSVPSSGVPSRASLFWDTETGEVSLNVDPTHIADSFPKNFWGLKYKDLPGPSRITGGFYWPHKYPLPEGLQGGSTHAALPITNKSAEKYVTSTDFHARYDNTASIYGSAKTDTVYAKVSLLNSVTNSIGIGAWSVDVKVTIKQNSDGSFKVHTDGNGYPATEAYYYPKAGGSGAKTIFLRKIHHWAFDRSIDAKFVDKINTGIVDPGGGIAALDIASDLSCDSRSDGGSDCDRDGMGANPLPNLIAPDSYGTSAKDPAG
ncbi:hypothetical protein [Patulibacter minatonensis]|uniref:hypothetical protein n=1 Tax=Patulibacter minatonensis TaxID=298163 RepID=UPI000479C4A0|nr:hypothetical protein [Patulibacter minatonensis]